MARADEAQRVTRLNLVFEWLQLGLSPPEVVQRLAVATASPQDKYVEEARRLAEPLAAVDTEIVFTIKLPRPLVERLHQYAESTGQTLSQIVSQALWALFRRGGHG